MNTKSKSSKQISPNIILLIGIILFIFSNGNWIIPIAAWMAPVFLLRFSRNSKPGLGLLLLFILITISTGFMLYDIVPSLLGILTYILIVYYAILWFFPYLMDKILSNKIGGFKSTLIFPIATVVAEYINNVLFGSWASYAYTQYDNLTLIQISSIFGIWGVTFIVMWFASTINWCIENNLKWEKVKSGVLIYTFTLLLILIYGGYQLGVNPPKSDVVEIASFTPTTETNEYYEYLDSKGIETSIEMAINDREGMSVVLKEVYKNIFNNYKYLAKNGASLLLLPEGLIKVLEEDEVGFVEQGKSFSVSNNVYLLLGYFVIPKDNPYHLGENKSALINPRGEVEWTFLKANPVPGSTDKAGDGILPIINTEFGKITSVICYDMDFTGLINKAGKNNIDIMLVPAWDWAAIDPLHTRMAVFRAIENGFSMIRQTGEGLSIAVDYQGRTIALMDHFTSDNHTMVAQIPIKGVKTLYSIIGDSFAWLCCIILILSIVLVPKRYK